MTTVAALFKRFKRNVRLRFFGDTAAFVILLEHDQERSSHIYRNVLPKLPIWDVVKATSSKGEADDFLRDEQIFIDKYNPATAAALFCTVSHLKVWKAIVAENLNHAIVLEDDVAIRDGFSSFLQKLKRQLPTSFDLVHLYVSEDRAEWLRHVANTKMAFVSYVPKWGRSAYLLSRSGANKLQSGFRTITRDGDCQISELAQGGKLSVYCASESYIDNLGQLTRRYHGERFRSNIWPRKEGDAPIDGVGTGK